MKKKWLFLFVLLILPLVGCQTDEGKDVHHGEVDDIKSLVHEYSVGYFPNETASITAHELIIIDQDGAKNIYDLPEDEFFVSIAPFITQTHDCFDHSLTGCQGELVEETFDIYLEDQKGNVLINDSMESFANGFIDLWLPRNETFHITIVFGDKKVESQFSTFSEDGTCITTMQVT